MLHSLIELLPLTSPAPAPPTRRGARASGILGRKGRSGIQQSLERRASEGEARALSALLKEHGPAIFDVCRYTVGPREAEDVCQAALMKIVRSIDKFDPDKGSFRTWALTVTRNLCRDRLRRRGLERKHFIADGESATEWTASGRPSPERIALARIESDRLMAALESLPEGMKVAVSLYHLHGASYEEIASTLEVPKGTVMTWLHRGRKRLREALEDGAEG